MSLHGDSNEEKIWNYLKSKGLNDFGISGLMGNLYAESALNPKNLQNNGNTKLNMTDEQFTATYDSGKYTNFVRDGYGYGLAQWTYWSRKQNLVDFAKSKSKSIGDLEMQLDFLYKELSEGYKSVLNVLKNATSILQASNSVLFNFERPANQDESVQSKRAEYGKKYYDKFCSSNKKEETSMYSRQSVVDLVNSWEGKKESDGSYKSIIDIYNSISPFPRNTKMQYGWAWCACTWSALAKKLGYTSIMPIEISCYYIIEAAKKMGCWQENDSYIPSPGDAILYDWDDNGAGDNTGNPDHIGTVIEVYKSAGYIVVMEGNYSNSVKKRTISINGKFIRGFITPKYTNNTVSEPSTNITGKSIDTLAREVIAGKYGSGDARKKALGNKYAEVQSRVNEILNGSATKPTTTTTANTNPVAKTVTSTCAAKNLNKGLAGTYVTTTDLYMRNDAGTNKKALTVLPKGTKVQCYGYYNVSNNAKWYYVVATIDGVTYTGFCHSAYLSKK